jgi:hypothetical protein
MSREKSPKKRGPFENVWIAVIILTNEIGHLYLKNLGGEKRT